MGVPSDTPIPGSLSRALSTHPGLSLSLCLSRHLAISFFLYFFLSPARDLPLLPFLARSLAPSLSHSLPLSFSEVPLKLPKPRHR